MWIRVADRQVTLKEKEGGGERDTEEERERNQERVDFQCSLCSGFGTNQARN